MASHCVLHACNMLFDIDFKSTFSWEQAGAVGLVLQASLLAVAVLIYWSNSLSHPSSLTFFLLVIVSDSVMFLCIFDQNTPLDFLKMIKVTLRIKIWISQ